MLWGGWGWWKGCLYETQSLASRDLELMVGSMMFDWEKGTRGHAREDSEAGFQLLWVVLHCQS